MAKIKLLKKGFILASGSRGTVIHHDETANIRHIFNHKLKADDKM